jgi:hypothetical protein
MTRKDYELIAGTIHRSRMAKSLIKQEKERNAAFSAISMVAIDMAATLANDNPRFDSDRFLDACGSF